MKELIKYRLHEELTKGDVKSEIDSFLNSGKLEDKVKKIFKDRVKNEKELEDKVVEITRNVLTQLYKTLWVKRGVWRNNLSNKSS
jgi:hypothetical protein